MKYYLICFVSFILLSCQEEITLNLPQAESKLVVEGSIEPGYPPYLILTKNQGYFEEIDNDTYANLFVNNVDSIKVWYIDNNGNEVSKSLGPIATDIAEEIIGIPIPLYTITDPTELLEIKTNPGKYNFSEAGRTYYLEIQWNNQIITAETFIPQPTPLDCLWVEKSEGAEKDHKCDIRAIYSDPADQQNNVLIKSKRLQHSEWADKDSLECDFTKTEDFPLQLIDAGSDVLINGEQFETYFPRPKEAGFPTGAYNTHHIKECDDGTPVEFEEDIVLIKFCQIDEPSMKFWRGLIRQKGSNGNPFAEPKNLVSNINGGLGNWTGYGAVYYKVPVIKEIVIDMQYTTDDGMQIIDIF